MNIAQKEKPPEYIPFKRNCEECGKECIDHEPINFICVIGSLGKKELLGHHMQCPQEEHWACCPEHLELIAVKCIKEDVIPFLKKTHDAIDSENGVKHVSINSHG